VKSTGVRAIFFDVGGTLIQPWPSVGEIYATVARRHSLFVEPADMESAFRESWAVLKNHPLTVSRKEWWRDVVFRTLGQDNEPCFEELYDIFAHFGAWKAYDDVEETLREARARNLHVGIISNWDQRLRHLLLEMELDQYFDSITVSCEVGVEKPGHAIFHEALLKAKVEPEQAVHVGDSEIADVEGAVAAGMRGFLLKRAGQGNTALRDLRDVWKRIDAAG